jgi:hypothetical protein
MPTEVICMNTSGMSGIRLMTLGFLRTLLSQNDGRENSSGYFIDSWFLVLYA